ncbi:MAG TPA: preprotein translocase subunit SecA, partial [Pseudolysinimonas sp.]|nr:preprotein translocase subunit SecA [Pseudolysinimonas sp.]
AKRGIKHEVLNAKNHAREAAIIAQAGQLNAVTVATNMAGRGTDIMLGGNAEFLAVAQMHDKGFSPVDTPDEYEAAWDDVFASVKAHVETEAAKVVAAGGLYVLGTERHESRRIDNQLRGRSGRQGDPGESRFYLSLEDDLMRLFNAGAAEALMGRAPADMAIESKTVSRAIRSAQSQVEARNAEIRKNVLKYDDVLNRQREAIYSDRRHILEGDDLHDRVQRFLEDVIAEVVDQHTADGQSDDWDLEALWTELRTLYPISITVDEVLSEVGNRGRLTAKLLREEVLSDAKLAYERREGTLGEQATRELERRVVLSVIDRRWRDHLYEMDYLKDGIGLRAMAQRDPLVEYQREGFALYQNMMGAIREESVGFLFNLEVEVTGGAQVAARGLGEAGNPNAGLSYSAPSADAQGEVEVRNQRGQLEQAATQRAQQQQAAQAAALAQQQGQQAPQQGGLRPTGQQPAPAQGGARGAFGQRQDGGAPAPQNRAERRAQEKRR